MLTVAVILFYFLLIFILYLYKKRQVALLITVFFLAGGLIFIKSGKIIAAFDNIIERSLVMHRGAIFYSDAINYRLLPQDEMAKTVVSRGQFFVMLAKGWFHLMLEPLPSSIKSLTMLASSFQMILWYPLIPFSIIGILLSLRYKFKESFILLLYFLFMGSALAVSGGNVGTTFRLRDTITPLFLLFSSVGIISVFFNLSLRKTQE